MKRAAIPAGFMILFVPVVAAAGPGGVDVSLVLSHMVIVTFALFAVMALATTLYSVATSYENWLRYLTAFLTTGTGTVLVFALIRPDMFMLPGFLSTVGAAVYVFTLIVAVIHLFRVRRDQSEVARLLLIYFILFYGVIGYGITTTVGSDTIDEPSEPRSLTTVELACHADPENQVTATLANTGDEPFTLSAAELVIRDAADEPVYTNSTLRWEGKAFGSPGGMDDFTLAPADTELSSDGFYMIDITLPELGTTTIGNCVPE